MSDFKTYKDFIDENLSLGDIGGMGAVSVPAPNSAEIGSGDVPAGRKKKKKKKKVKIKSLKEFVNEGRPFFQDTPNEFAYLDFKKWAYKNRGKIKKKLQDALGPREDGTKMYIELSRIWRFDWATKHAEEWSYLHSTDVARKDFGRALAAMMKSDNLIIKKNGNKLTTIN